MPSRLRSERKRSQGGAAAVEFALVMIPFIALLLGTLQFAWYFFAAQSASSAAREGARQLVVGKCWNTPATPTSFTTYVTDQAPMITSSTYSPAVLSSASVGDVVTVTVTADAGIINFITLPGGGQVQREFEARLEDKKPGDGSC